MQRITPDRPWPLLDAAATRAAEQAETARLPPHTLMQRAGLAVARLTMALAPHAKTVWIACGPGNNGGDGMEAAMHLRQWGKHPVVTCSGDETKAPADAAASLRRAHEAGVTFLSESPPHWDFGIDALLGLGNARPLEGRMAQWALALGKGPALAVDLPSGLDADTGSGAALRVAHTLSLLSLKPGLFTGGGRDAAGQVWFDDLDVPAAGSPTAWLAGPPEESERLHATHKGSYGDVAIIGGAAGMTGAALLAASAALHAGAGRVFAALLDNGSLAVDTAQPDLMLRPWDSLDLAAMSVACGCGGGDAVRAVLPKVLSTSQSLVLDADALNAIADDAQLQALLQARSRRDRPTVLTPHPLEAARMIGCAAAQVQADRLAAGRELVKRFGCVVVLKGSGSVIAAPEAPPLINSTGNARLAIAGTGDVLAGMIAARLAAGLAAREAAAGVVYAHGLAADNWPQDVPLTASALARLSCRT
ncbi:NAD(P)H-hydrate dehydratase [Caenimonas soli]|uniref:NAD(P)H-hydrate dehydratase n=1 Tax=Caenimonas soli TaxID=2735555 RepID=UPI0015559ACF|nr:NAD(P)H-hydrate dehydratase [Caenimonas soli]NPC54489.1 NAD(P)H-hydrate dehydratase [Caenimonas soli]